MKKATLFPLYIILSLLLWSPCFFEYFGLGLIGSICHDAGGLLVVVLFVFLTVIFFVLEAIFLAVYVVAEYSKTEDIGNSVLQEGSVVLGPTKVIFFDRMLYFLTVGYFLLYLVIGVFYFFDEFQFMKILLYLPFLFLALGILLLSVLVFRKVSDGEIGRIGSSFKYLLFFSRVFTAVVVIGMFIYMFFYSPAGYFSALLPTFVAQCAGIFLITLFCFRLKHNYIEIGS